MCRWITYAGPEIHLEKLIYEPEYSLVRQSHSARRSVTPTNGDGSGIGWYGSREAPGLYREIRPAWNDVNLRSLAHQVRSRLFFAHVRASTGTAASLSNCHPFAHGKWMFMHNGQIGGYERIRRALDAHIPDAFYNNRAGTTDSEAFFYILFGQGLERDPVGALSRTIALVLDTMAKAKIKEEFRMTAALSDGETLYALRYSADPDHPTLFYHRDGAALTVVSEPLDAIETNWTSVANRHLLVATAGQPLRIEPFAAA